MAFFYFYFNFVFVWRFIAGLAGRVILHWRIHSLIILFPYKNKNMYVSHPREDKYKLTSLAHEVVTGNQV